MRQTRTNSESTNVAPQQSLEPLDMESMADFFVRRIKQDQSISHVFDGYTKRPEKFEPFIRAIDDLIFGAMTGDCDKASLLMIKVLLSCLKTKHDISYTQLHIVVGFFITALDHFVNRDHQHEMTTELALVNTIVLLTAGERQLSLNGHDTWLKQKEFVNRRGYDKAHFISIKQDVVVTLMELASIHASLRLMSGDTLNVGALLTGRNILKETGFGHYSHSKDRDPFGKQQQAKGGFDLTANQLRQQNAEKTRLKQSAKRPNGTGPEKRRTTIHDTVISSKGEVLVEPEQPPSPDSKVTTVIAYEDGNPTPGAAHAEHRGALGVFKAVSEASGRLTSLLKHVTDDAGSPGHGALVKEDSESMKRRGGELRVVFATDPQIAGCDSDPGSPVHRRGSLPQLPGLGSAPSSRSTTPSARRLTVDSDSLLRRSKTEHLCDAASSYTDIGSRSTRFHEHATHSRPTTAKLPPIKAAK